MNNKFITKLKNAFVKNSHDNLPILSLRSESMYSLRAMTHYNTNDDYENGYSSIRAIADHFLEVRPFAVDAQGERIVETPNVIKVLSRPNTDMSPVDFRDAFAVMTMVFDKVYILVHQYDRQNNKTKPAEEGVDEANIAGFTFLEGVTEDYQDGHVIYKVTERTGDGTATVDKIYQPYQVIVLKDTNPGNLSAGYSPSRAAKRWATIDDYIADYQQGFFENGAVPAGQFIITAPTTKEYEDIVSGLKEKHQGAGKNNNVVYTYQPIDPDTGKAAQATITWVPFNTSNKDMSLKELFTQANKKIDSVYRVSAFIRAIDEAPNRATAQVLERKFIKDTVRPFTIKKWARFQHELNRITGGLGYGISFKIDVPNVAEEDKLEAETNQIRVQTIKALLDMGFTTAQAIAALDLPTSFTILIDENAVVQGEDDPDVDEVGESDDSPGNGGAAKRKNPKVRDQFTEEDTNNYIQQLKEPTRVLMDKQVQRAIDTLDPDDAVDATEEDKETFVDEMMLIIAAILLAGGIDEWEAGRQMLMAAGFDAPSETYNITDKATDSYRAYLKTIADSYTDDTANSIRSVLSRGQLEAWSKSQLETGLRDIMNTDDWRVTRLATSEMNRSGSLAGVESMVKLNDEVEDATIEKSMLSTSGSPCEFCATRIGVWFPVDEIMVPKGTIVTGIDGGMYVNNWDNNRGHDLHANGQCVPQFRVVT